MTFHLNSLPFGTTLARQIAKQHLTRFNNVYWIAERSHKHTRGAFSAMTFPKLAPGVHGIFASEADWEIAADQHHAWVRQHIIVSTASLLEVYVKAASVSAVTAKLELIDRSYAGVDGFSFIKSGKTPKPLKDLIDNVTAGFINGPWDHRFRRIARVFGKIPPSLSSLSTILQSVQTKRNKIAHEFGADGKGRRAPWEAFNVMQIGPKEIETGITAVSKAIAVFDTEIFGPSIGGHEMLLQYHLWKGKEKNFQQIYVSGGLIGKFRTYLGTEYGNSPSADYIKGMIKYYDGI